MNKAVFSWYGNLINQIESARPSVELFVFTYRGGSIFFHPFLPSDGWMNLSPLA